MEYRRSVLVQDESVPAGSVKTYDLPVNPLSHIVFTLKGLNVTDEATLEQILSRVTRIEVTRFGSSVFAMSASDLHKLDAILFGNMPILANQVPTNNAVRWISLVIPFSRKMYDPNEGLPATTKGELKLQITLDSVETEINGIIYQIETVEMIGATPKSYLKATTLTITPTSGIENDIDLPIGNKLAGLLIYSTTIPTGTSWTTTVDKVRLLINNVERFLASSNWESLHGDLLKRLGHREAYDASADNDDVKNYAFVDFDPLGDGQYLLDTKGASRVVLKVTAGDANQIRVIPLEVV
jgi:hypothetical protein